MGQAKGTSGPCPLVWTSHMHTGQAFAEGHAGGTGVSGPRSQGGVVGATPAAGTLSATIAGEECTVVGDGTGGSAAGARGVASPGEKSGGVSHIKQQRTPVGGVLGSKARRWPGWRRGAKANSGFVYPGYPCPRALHLPQRGVTAYNVRLLEGLGAVRVQRRPNEAHV